MWKRSDCRARATASDGDGGRAASEAWRKQAGEVRNRREESLSEEWRRRRSSCRLRGSGCAETTITSAVWRGRERGGYGYHGRGGVVPQQLEETEDTFVGCGVQRDEMHGVGEDGDGCIYNRDGEKFQLEENDPKTSLCCSEVILKQKGWRLGISDLVLNGAQQRTSRH